MKNYPWIVYKLHHEKAVSLQMKKTNNKGADHPRCLISTFVFHCLVYVIYMSLVMRKPAFLICENKDADQLCGNRKADQRLCFRYTDSIIPLLSKYEISNFLPYSVIAQPSLCQTWSETPKTVFLTTRLILFLNPKYQHLACFCSCTGSFVSCLIRNLEYRFSGDECHMSRVMRKPAFRLCEKKDADQLRSRSAPLFSLHG